MERASEWIETKTEFTLLLHNPAGQAFTKMECLKLEIDWETEKYN